jgi:hypothetical protein
MSLTISNNSLAQQQAVQAQVAPAQTSATSQSAASPSTATSTGATADPSAALISGNAGLTSDLLSVLLQEQSNATGSSSGTLTLADMLDDEGGTSGTTSGTTSGSDVTLAGMLNAEDQAQTDQTQTDSFVGLDPSLAAQSATSTSDVMGGLQDLLDQLTL